MIWRLVERWRMRRNPAYRAAVEADDRAVEHAVATSAEHSDAWLAAMAAIHDQADEETVNAAMEQYEASYLATKQAWGRLHVTGRKVRLLR